ncbi:helix-turn-helix transcriptional regulator [Streptomyces aurantiacus]|uniref:Transcriptional regulator n=1 Tax=Streptomyces aurantiacus TaxID=47760 RepID=A0A7G1P8U6_9ACTN|nr:helix-turn-helix transcriptional regulator [Streptomyces aurantiacus]BCL32173.1 transcriptional regulator [Streptomyces aurantiacus]
MGEQEAVHGLGGFLRARRALVRPEDHGMPAGTRRTPGLRREEVAMLARVSTDYYVRLEQGRDKHPSPQVLAALAQALLLDEEAVAYLRELAEPAVSARSRRTRRRERAAPGLVALLEVWQQTPALVYGRYMDLLAANPLGEALFSWLGEENNLLRAIFLDSTARSFYRDWERIGEGCVAALRTANTDPGDRRLAELVGELSLGSARFAQLWARQEVRAKTAEVKHLCHPLVGELALRFENLTIPGAPGQHLVVYHAEPGSREDDALALLGSYSSPPATAPDRPGDGSARSAGRAAREGSAAEDGDR